MRNRDNKIEFIGRKNVYLSVLPKVAHVTVKRPERKKIVLLNALL